MKGMLAGKHIVVGITGGIAAFKSAALVRLLVKEGAEVQVIMTPAAKEFITPLTLSTLSRNPVISEFFTANTGEWHSHVDLGLWADAMVVAPATANTIAKMANGVADNMLVTSYLSARAQVFVAPAMDFDMMQHPSTTANIERLKTYGNIIIEPENGELASGLVGKGRMAEPETILEVITEWFMASEVLNGRKILITAGPTVERIDPVRFLSNFSSGKMGYALARAALNMGAEVTLVSGPVNIKLEHPALRIVNVESAREMLKACEEEWPHVDMAIMSAAVGDYRPATFEEKKIKREKQDSISLELVKNPDIAATLGASKKPGQLLIGFALETDNELDNAMGKMKRKNLDAIVLNSLNDKGAGFGTDTNKVTLIQSTGKADEYPLMSKSQLSRELMKAFAGWFE